MGFIVLEVVKTRTKDKEVTGKKCINTDYIISVDPQEDGRSVITLFKGGQSSITTQVEALVYMPKLTQILSSKHINK